MQIVSHCDIEKLVISTKFKRRTIQGLGILKIHKGSNFEEDYVWLHPKADLQS